MQYPSLHPLQVQSIVKRAIDDDATQGEWSTDLCIPQNKIGLAHLVAKESLVVAGTDTVEAVVRHFDPRAIVTQVVPVGTSVMPGTELLKIEAQLRALVRSEAIAVDILSRLCGFAAVVRESIECLSATRAILVQSKKATPGWRLLEKSAATIGGARNYRFGLCDGVVVNGHHINAAGGIAIALERLRESLSPTVKVEVEVGSLAELQAAIDAGADLVRLGFSSLAEVQMAVRTARGRAYVEYDGDIAQRDLPALAATGVDLISTSCLRGERLVRSIVMKID